MNSKIVTYIVVAFAIIAISVIAALKFGGSGKSVTDTTGTNSNTTNNTTSQNGTTDNSTAANNNSNSSATAQNSQVVGCPSGQDVTQTDANGRFKPTMDISNKTAVLTTDMGAITIQLYDTDAPKTVENFICLAQNGYYNNLTFHRIAHGFVIQGGDPSGNGSGGTSIYGKSFEDELYSDTPSYKAGYLKGVVAMANSGPNTNGSQFFIMLEDHTDLPHNYTIFGKVTAGQSVVDKIGAVKITPVNSSEDGSPVTPIHIKSVTIK